MKAFNYLFSILFLTLFQSSFVQAQATFELETGALFNGYNDVRIPGDGGTFFSLTEDLNAQTALFYRLRLSYVINSRHYISALYAPLQVRSEGSIAEDIIFEGVLFGANNPLEGTYKFNSYRLTYRYDFVQREKLEFGLGFTAKIRDARIALASDQLTSEKVNVGFVPIINFRLLWKINDKFNILLDGDALAAPQGRAADVLIAPRYNLSERLKIYAGYRILEGGAANDEVYNFSLFHYASVGLTYTFMK